MELCGVCGETETGRLIEGIPVCGRCFVEGGLNLPKNQKILKKVYDSPYKEPGTPDEPTTVSKPPVSKPATEGVGDYLCPKCPGNVTHRAGSKIHKRHLKFLK